MEERSKRRGWRTLLPFRRSKRRKLEIPLEHVGLVSYLTYSWLDGFMWRAFRSGLTADTIWKCPQVDGAEHNARRLEQMWQEELDGKGREGASLSRVFMRFIRQRLLLSMVVLVLAMALLLLTVAYILLEVLKYSYAREGQLWRGLIFVAAFLVADILQNILFICVFSISHIAGARLRSGALLMLYRKLLTVPYLKDKTTGYIVNLFANDSQRIFDGVSYASMLLVAPLLGIATTAYAIYLIGVWSLVGFAVLLLLFPIQMCIGKLIMTLRARAMTITDRRVCLMGEVLANIKFIKMYSWEKPLAKDVMEIRDGEKSVLRKVNMATSMMFSISAIVVAMATISSIMAHTLTGHDLTAVQAFTYLAVFSSIQGKLMLSTMGVKHFSELKVTANRFQEVLMLKERPLLATITESSPPGGSDYVIELENASLAWSGAGHVVGPAAEEVGFQNGPTSNGHVKKGPISIDQPSELHLLNTTTQEGEEPRDNVLTSITFRIHRGDVVGVTGPIGSGKSALLTGLLGQMRITHGDVCVYGKVAYVPQQAWLFNTSLRENILFGSQMDEQRYSAVIEACCLKMDIDVLPTGDATEVGERGVTLSGGQKQRISLARALYSDRDIYLLDDPFSAVDPDIADRLYQQVVQNHLVGKTVLFVTHAAKYLPSCDHILYLRGGTIVQQGTHDDLREAGGEYSDFYLNAKEHDGDSRDPMTEVTESAMTSQDRRSVIRRTSTRKKREEINEEAKKLIEKEEQEVGAVRWRTYRNYMAAAGGVISVIVVLVLFVLAEGSRAFSYWWLAHWLSKGSANTTVKVGNTTMISKSITDNPNLGFYNLVYGLTTIGTLVLFLIKAAVFTKVSIRASNKLHQWLLRAVLRCPMTFFDTTPLGRIMNRFSKDMDELDSQLPTMVEQTIQSIVSIIMYIVMIGVIIQWFLVAIPPLAIIFLFVYAIFRVGLRDIKRLQNISVSPLLSHISATMQGLHSLHAYNKVQDFTDRFVEMLDHNTVTLILFNCGMRWINLRLSFITSIIVCVTALLVVLLHDVVKPAYAGLAIVYSAQLAGLFQFLVRSAVESEARFTSAERVNSYAEDLREEGPLVVDRYRPPGTWPSDGHIRFTDYRMRYREGLPLVLKGVTCEFKPGERVGIVGRTGSGKSSLASALFRLVEPSSGYVEIDAMDITRMGFEDLRTRLSAIPQDPVLFSGTVRSNLDPFHHHIDLELWRALEKCHIKDTILTLDQQLDAPVTEGGENFSSGERQLLCIARVFLRHSKILVLDEATAAMDSEMDALIQTALKEVFEGCTLLIIAHRLNTVLHVDRVLVMEKGEVVEFDTPEALMANENSRFNQLMSLNNEDSTKQTESMDMLASDAWV